MAGVRTGRQKELDGLNELYQWDKRFRKLRENANFVPGDGPLDPVVMFIGEAPGADEDKQLKPFVGRSGEKLNDMLKLVEIERSECYITNIVKYRPPNNRTPTTMEISWGWEYLRNEIALVRPGVVATLGAASLTPFTNRGLKLVHGTTIRWGPGIILVPLHHPAYLLRFGSSENNSMYLRDFQFLKGWVDEE